MIQSESNQLLYTSNHLLFGFPRQTLRFFPQSRVGNLWKHVSWWKVAWPFLTLADLEKIQIPKTQPKFVWVSSAIVERKEWPAEGPEHSQWKFYRPDRILMILSSFLKYLICCFCSPWLSKQQTSYHLHEEKTWKKLKKLSLLEDIFALRNRTKVAPRPSAVAGLLTSANSKTSFWKTLRFLFKHFSLFIFSSTF